MEFKGKLIHCNEICEKIEDCPVKIDNYKYEFSMNVHSFKESFFEDLGLEYILDYFLDLDNESKHFHIAVHSMSTNTCQEKAKIINFPLERVIKGFYLEDFKEKKIYGIAIPGNETYDKLKIADFLGINRYSLDGRIGKTKERMPVNIKYGVVHPFVNEDSFALTDKLESILFDKIYLEKSRNNNYLDDFSFTTHESSGYNNHNISIQINYSDAFDILKNKFGEDKIKAIDLVNV